MIKYILRFLLGGEFACLAFLLAPAETKEKIKKDVTAEMRAYSPYVWWKLVCDKKKYRNIFYYRIRSISSLRWLCGLSTVFLKPVDTIEIGGEIGGGLVIVHNYAVISVGHAGENLTVYQGVSIGQKRHAEWVSLGDNVVVYPNATLFGEIRIGSNVIIGSGAVVNKDVPDGAVVVGNPFRIIHKAE